MADTPYETAKPLDVRSLRYYSTRQSRRRAPLTVAPQTGPSRGVRLRLEPGRDRDGEIIIAELSLGPLRMLRASQGCQIDASTNAIFPFV
jgi:hypothetical protein